MQKMDCSVLSTKLAQRPQLMLTVTKKNIHKMANMEVGTIFGISQSKQDKL